MGRVLPILFNTNMVRAILDGSKTVTRRLIKPQPTYSQRDGFSWKGAAYGTDAPPTIKGAAYNFRHAAPYRTGDILYVRETWQYIYELDGNEQIIEDTGRYYYAATDTLPFNMFVDSRGIVHENIPWRPAIHMPKEAARIWLKVTNVRMERLQEITEEQAEEEGCQAYSFEQEGAVFGQEDIDEWTAKAMFADLWDSMLKKDDVASYGWDSNPWVWVIEFEWCDKPRKRGLI